MWTAGLPYQEYLVVIAVAGIVQAHRKLNVATHCLAVQHRLERREGRQPLLPVFWMQTMLAAMAARAAARAARPTARAAHPSPGMRPLIRLMASGSGSKPAKSSNATGKPAVWTDHGNHYRSRRGHIAPHKTGRSLQPSARPASQGRVAAAAAAAARPNKTTSIVPLRDPFGTPPARDRDAAAPKRTVADENDEAPRPVRKKWGFKKRYQDEETEEIEAGDPNLASLMRSNREWAAKTWKENPDYFDKMMDPQTPEYLYIGCSDSRVPSSVVLNIDPGDIFTHRNVGNLFCNNDFNALTVLEYAVDVLKVKHIIVTGHYGCGAVEASMTRQDMGVAEHWVKHIRDVYRLHNDELNSISSRELRLRRLVELNVMEQCLNLYKTSCVQRKRAESTEKRLQKRHKALEAAGDADADAAGADTAEEANGEDDPNFATPRIHALVFDPKDGLMHPLPVDFKMMVQKHQHIYDLYQTPSFSSRG